MLSFAGDDLGQTRYTGIFDFGLLYKLVWDFLRERHYDIWDKQHKDKIADLGYETKFKIDGDLKVDKVIKYQLKIYIHGYDMHDMTIEMNGKKKVVNDGKVHVEIKGSVIWDYNNRYSDKGGNGKGFTGALATLFAHKVLFRKIEWEHINDLEAQIYELTDTIRKSLSMYERI